MVERLSAGMYNNPGSHPSFTTSSHHPLAICPAQEYQTTSSPTNQRLLRSCKLIPVPRSSRAPVKLLHNIPFGKLQAMICLCMPSRFYFGFLPLRKSTDSSISMRLTVVGNRCTLHPNHCHCLAQEQISSPPQTGSFFACGSAANLRAELEVCSS